MLALYLSLLPDDEDRALFLQIYEKYERKLYAVAFSMLREAHAAEDAVQNAMVNVIQSFDTAKKIISDSCSDLAPWLVTIVKNVARDELRKRGRMVEFPEEWDMPCWDDGAARTEFDALVELIRAMPEGCRAILELRLVQEWSFREIGKAMGLKEDAARRRFDRGLKLLQDKLREEGYAYDGSGV